MRAIETCTFGTQHASTAIAEPHYRAVKLMTTGVLGAVAVFQDDMNDVTQDRFG